MKNIFPGLMAWIKCTEVHGLTPLLIAGFLPIIFLEFIFMPMRLLNSICFEVQNDQAKE